MKRINLVLSGGGARGFAHLGILKHLEELSFHVSAISGTSAGALFGALYAAGLKPKILTNVVKIIPFRMQNDVGGYQCYKLSIIFSAFNIQIRSNRIMIRKRFLTSGKTFTNNFFTMHNIIDSELRKFTCISNA